MFIHLMLMYIFINYLIFQKVKKEVIQKHL
jgi:hypothetical protein